MVLIFYIFFKNKIKNKILEDELEELNKKINKIDNEINILNENNYDIKNEKIKLKEKINLKNNLEKEKIKNKYKNINKLEIINLINEKNINQKIENIQNMISTYKTNLHKLEIDKENVAPKLDNLSKIEEEIIYYQERLVNIKNKEKSINLAKEVLTNSYQKMKQNITPKLTKQLSENVGIITKGKYLNAIYNEEQGLMVELDNGDYVNANKLSIGTIDQLYMSLRMSMIDDLTQEKLPIIMDESFAYYDNERLKNILIYLSEKNLKNRQVIIFTCTNREKEILENKKIDFNYIEI